MTTAMYCPRCGWLDNDECLREMDQTICRKCGATLAKGGFIKVQAPNQGWQCPVCKTVWSPGTPQCYNCQPAQVTCSCNQIRDIQEKEGEGI